MRIYSNRMACVVAMLLLAVPVLAQEYLYTPAPAAGDAAASGEGVLVREVMVKKGDTLYHLSRQFSGKGSYYPQILLFNELKNPNLIHPGDVLRVPVSAKAAKATAAADQDRQESKPLPRKPAAAKSPDTKKPAAAHAPKKAEPAPKAQPAPAAAERSQYARAQEAVKKGDCQSAIKLLDGFIAAYPASSLVPEATLSRAECYMKLSSP